MNPVPVAPKPAMNMKKMISIGIGVVLGIIIIFLGFTMLQGVFTRASDSKPTDVVVAEISQNSAKVTWTTDQETQSVVEYGTSPSPTSLSFFAPESAKTKTHSVDLTLLSDSTTYYFDIRVGDTKYDNGGIPWTFTTKSKDAATGGSTVLPSAAVSPTAPAATVAPTAGTGTCNYATCDEIKANLGKNGCTTQQYILCLRK